METPAQKVLLNTAIDLDGGRLRLAGVAYAIPIVDPIVVRLIGVSNVRAVIIHALDAVAITVRASTPAA